MRIYTNICMDVGYVLYILVLSSVSEYITRCHCSNVELMHHVIICRISIYDIKLVEKSWDPNLVSCIDSSIFTGM